MSVSEVYNLLKKFREKKCSPEELAQLNDWYEQFIGEAEHIPGIPSEKLEALWNDIENRVKFTPKRSRNVKLIRWLNVAAILTLFIGIGICFLIHKPNKELQVVEASIQPGKNMAVLKLSDGRKVVLTDMVSVQEEDGTLIRNEQSKQLDYSNVKGVEGKTLMNTVEVPLGGEYQLVLSDGTKVWLNSGTELSYPVSFAGKNREVTLTGEAYFEVTKTGLPFIVKTTDINIRVLGTKFNVSAYADDAQTVSTLVTGSVAVQNNHSNQEYLLKPGNSAFYNSLNPEVEIRNTDTDLYTAWIKGEFRFVNMRLEDILMKLNRWYNCSMIYEKEDIKNLRFSGAAEKDRPIGYILKMIETVTDVKFEINGNIITVRR